MVPTYVVVHRIHSCTLAEVVVKVRAILIRVLSLALILTRHIITTHAPLYSFLSMGCVTLGFGTPVQM